MRLGKRILAGLAAAVAWGGAVVMPAHAQPWTPPQPTYQLNDNSAGRTLSILPPGEHGLVNATDLLQYEANGTRPFGSQDQLAPYANLLYNASGLTDAQLPDYFNDESFGIAPGQVTRSETPSATQNVVIYRDQHDVPHIYGATRDDVAYGAGYAAGEDRLFEMDVLRHYGAGTLSAFLGPSCSDEQMDHDSLLLGGYTQAQKQAQIDALPVLYGSLGASLQSMLYSYVAGINAYVTAANSNPLLLPADYAAAVAPPQLWSATDIIDIATLVGGIFGKGGGNELANSALLRYLQSNFGSTAAHNIFSDFKEQNDPQSPTTAATSFPYATPGTVDPSKVAIPDSTSLTGGPTDTTPGCNPTQPPLAAMQVLAGLLEAPHAMSNALLIDAAHSADGHPVAVMGPQVGYYTPEILMEEDLHATDGSYDVQGASFPGTNFLVELGRGRDFAWSATSAETDNVDQRLEAICDPNGGQPAANGTNYMLNGRCVPMRHENFTEIAFTKPGGQGLPVVISHDLYYTNPSDPIQGIVQGWTTSGGNPVAVVNQRSTYNHEVDSGIGFLRFGMPSQTFDINSWMQGAAAIQYTFNWFYVDSTTIGYYESGLLPIRPSDVDPNLPTWGDGRSEWNGFLDFNSHVHQVDSPTGYITSWNNRGAPSFSAADDKYSWGPVQRVQSLNEEIEKQFTLHGGKLTRANVVTAMETAAAVDLEARQVLPLLLTFVANRSEPAGVQAMLTELQPWVNDGGMRRKASPSDGQYADAAAVAIMDQLFPALNRAFFDSLFSAGGVHQYNNLDAGYNVFPMAFEGTPNGFGSHSGSSYQDGWDGYDWKVLRTLNGSTPTLAFSSDTTSRTCGTGLNSTNCGAAIDAALLSTYNALVAANGGGTTVSSWTQDAATKSAGQTMPQYDSIHFVAVGIVGQPNIDWQNRPTFQQVVEFVASARGVGNGALPESPAAIAIPVLGAFMVLVGVSPALRRRHRRTRS
jgi:acyl-homoserine lactone acylase PvdQ